ncbi:MAG: hypothetical protein ABW005_02940 [Burkholderiaceae bacterium]
MARILGFCLLLALALSACSDEPAAGIYGTEGGWGTLQISAGKLHINANGSNGHGCTVDAQRQDGSWQTEVLDATACRLSFKFLGQGRWTVSGEPMEACRAFCGARANFQGDYVALPAGCTPPQQRLRHDAALRLYAAQRYGQAQATMTSLASECAVYLDWREKYSLANDQAITAWHLGDLVACRQLSASVINEEQLELLRQVAPSDYESYKPRVDAARFNFRRCGG